VQKENSPGNGTSKEAPEGGEKLQGRMKIASGGLAILDRTEGLIAQGKLSEAKDTIRQSLSEGVEFRMSNVGMRADCLRLAYHAGFQDEVAKSIDDLLKITRSQPKELDTAYLYWGKVIRLLGVLGRVGEANTMTEEGAEGGRDKKRASERESVRARAGSLAAREEGHLLDDDLLVLAHLVSGALHSRRRAGGGAKHPPGDRRRLAGDGGLADLAEIPPAAARRG
jgi:hypothetical protein